MPISLLRCWFVGYSVDAFRLWTLRSWGEDATYCNVRDALSMFLATPPVLAGSYIPPVTDTRRKFESGVKECI